MHKDFAIKTKHILPKKIYNNYIDVFIERYGDILDDFYLNIKINKNHIFNIQKDIIDNFTYKIYDIESKFDKIIIENINENNNDIIIKLCNKNKITIPLINNQFGFIKIRIESINIINYDCIGEYLNMIQLNERIHLHDYSNKNIYVKINDRIILYNNSNVIANYNYEEIILNQNMHEIYPNIFIE